MEHIVRETAKVNISNVNKNINIPLVLKTRGHSTTDIITVIYTAKLSMIIYIYIYIYIYI